MKPVYTLSQDFVRLSNRSPVRAQRLPLQTDHVPHNHEFYEICLVLGGTARHLTAEGGERLLAGSVVVVAPGQVHGFADTRRLAILNIYYLAEWFLANLHALEGIDRLVPLFFQRALFPSATPGRVAHFKITPDELADCLHDFDQLIREEASPHAEVLFLEAAFLKCLIRLARASARDEHRAPLPTPDGPVARSLAAIERLVRAGAPLDVARIAHEAGVSLGHFCRVFKTQTGLTAGAYFQRRRIQRACHRLLTTPATATEIAHQLGFADSPHFNRAFKQTTGLTPRAYRLKFSA